MTLPFSFKCIFKYSLFFLFLLVFQINGLSAQGLKAGPQVLTFHSSVDDTEQPYGLYLPKNYDANKKYPFVVMLHGAGSNHRLALRRVFGKSNAEGETDVEASRYFPNWEDRDYIVASPFARGTMGYVGIPEKDVLDVIADVKARFSIDEDRTYLTGLSMGGGGTLWLGLSYPDMWAAIAPVCPAPPAGAKELTGNALNVPVHIFQGGDDPVVKPEGVRQWVENLKAEGAMVEYKEYPGVKHDSWVNAYENEFIFDWFDQFQRIPNPDKVQLSTQRYAASKAYWAQILQFTPGTTAKLTAEFKGLNQLDISTENIQTLSFDLSGHAKFKSGLPLKMTIDGQKVTHSGGTEITLSNEAGSWTTGSVKFPKLFKRSGSEGPMSAVVADRHIYVYGTSGNPTPEELEARRKAAEKAANWSFYRGEFLGRIMVFPRVLSDMELRDSDYESSNLILFGDEKTNRAIAKIADQLPMKLTWSPEEYGMAYIYPLGDNYVLINSGLSIFDAPDSDKAISGLSRLTSPAILGALRKFDDYVIFTKDKIISSGFFSNDWKLKKTNE